MPTPSVIISTTFEDIYAETDASLFLTCDVHFDPSLAGYVNVSLTWIKGSSPLSDFIDRVSISSYLVDSQFISNLTLYPVSIEESTNFTCRARIIPTDNFTSATASDTIEETIEVIVQSKLLVSA